MKLQAFVSLMFLAGGLPSALARMPFESDFGGRLGPTLAKGPVPAGAEGNRADVSAKDLARQQRGTLGNRKASVGNARR